MHDLDDKQWWCEYGEELEREFVRDIAFRYGLDAVINPEKEDNPYVPDLIVNGEIADLKVQTTPFFTAAKYGFDPQHTVTFNYKNRCSYALYYPGIVIYFLVNWRRKEWNGIVVEPLYGVWRVRFRDMRFTVLHTYHRNGKSSYLFDLREFERLVYIENDSY